MNKLVSALPGGPMPSWVVSAWPTKHILWGLTVIGCDYSDLSGVKQNQTFPSLCCLRRG